MTALAKLEPLTLTRSGGLVWSTAMEERLRQLVAEKNSGGQITEVLNQEFSLSLSRSAIMGKAHRSGLKLLSQAGNTLVNRLRTGKFVPNVPKRKRVPVVNFKYIARPELVDLPPAPADSDIPLAQLRTILTIGKGECRFYVDRDGPDQLFCAAPIREDSPFCPHHHARAHV